MEPPDWRRILLCGLLTGLVWTLLSATLLAIVGTEFLAAIASASPESARRIAQAFPFLANLAAGVWAMWLYTAIRPRYGPGVKTAACAGVAWWIIVSLQSGKWVAVASVPLQAIWAPLTATLPAIVLAAMAGGWLYEHSWKRAARPSTA